MTQKLLNDEGDVVLCGPVPDGLLAGGQSEASRVCFTASLDCRSDLEGILRELSRTPRVRHVALCGDDPRPTGEALLSVLRHGVDERGRLRDARGVLSPDLDAKTVDALRAHLHVWDWREKPAPDVAACLRDLDRQPGTREVAPLADPEVPARKVFLSRKTSFPIFSGDVGDAWLQLLNLVLKVGVEKTTDAGERFAQALNTVVTVGLPVIAEDLEVEEPALRREHADHLDFNAADFDRYFGRLRAEPPALGSRPGDRFGARLHDLHGLDRLDSVRSELMRAPRSATSTIVFRGSGGEAPGLLSATFDVTDGALFGSFVFRSVDAYSDWPLEAMALARFQRQLAQGLGLAVGASTFVLHDAHLLARDWSRTKRLLDEHFRRPLPLQVDHSGVFLFGNDGGKARGMLLDHDAGTIFWEDAFDNAQQLSWYIVDSMPWLLPQHIRYVGQECSTLTRAMEEKACYLQG